MSVGNFTYTENGTNRTITGYTGGGVVVIPATIGGGAVTAIGNDAFKNNQTLTAVTIPEGVTTIGSYAFAGCISMKSITLPNSLSSIGRSAFESCGALASISIPNLVTAIESDTFSQCVNLASVSLPSNLTRIESGAFAFCYYKLTTITIPKTVTKIVGGAFYDCLVLAEVKFEGPYPDINSFAFRLNNRSGEVSRNAKGYYLASESGTWTGKMVDGLTLVQPPAAITLSTASGSYTLLQAAVPLDGSLTVSGEETFSGATVQIETGFASGDTLSLTPSIGGITGTYDGIKGILTLSGSGNASAYQSALRAVTFSTISTSIAERGFKVTLGSAISFGGHYYEFVPGSHSWSGARTLALSKTFNGLSGYLANLTSADENSFVKTKIGTDVWIGGSDEGTEGVWKWMDGPEAGQIFWNGLASGSAPSGRYANWYSGEPNQSEDEDYAQFYVGTGQWNDLGSGSRLGFLVEYGTDTSAIQTFSGTRTFSVTKATPTITAAPTAAPISYGQTLGSSTFSGGSTSVPGRFAFTTPSIAPNAGTASQSVTFTPTDTANYSTVTTSVIVAVNKATPTITALPGFMSATGGTKSGSGDFIIHTFTNVGNSTFKPTGSGTVEILVVAGGGGAGFDGGGGGGAGGVITSTVSVTAGTDYTVVVGGGGAAAISPQSGPNGYPGGNSQFGSFTAIGGAGGYNGHAGITAITTGGSGGGQGFIDVGVELIAGGPGLGTSGQGNQGGLSFNGSAGGGGGGAGEVGGNASIGKGGNGGNGIQSGISGMTTWYGGGGAGGSWNGTGGTGGMGGGGNGGGDEPATAGANGIANTGGGGGGNGRASRNDSGMGGSGIVIVRYKPNILLPYGQLSGDAAFSGATASVPGSFAFANPSASVGTSSQSVIFTPTDTVNYNTATRSVSVTVTKATPIITAPTATSIAYGQTLAFSTLSGGSASVAGTFAFTTPSTAPNVGTAPQSVTFTPNDTDNYNTVPTLVSVTVNQALISSGFSHTLYLGAGATSVTAWGLNTDGRLGVGDMDSPVNWAEAVDGDFSVETVTGLAAGGTHSLILAGGQVYAAGSNRFGQLGQGAVNGASKSKFTSVVLPSIASSTPVAIAAGGNHSLIVTADGKVFACGDNTYGQLAQPTATTSSAAWVEVTFEDPITGLSPEIVSVVAGADHNLAVDEDGGVWVWGRNNYGQLGIGKRSLAERTPLELNLGDEVLAESVAAGFSHSLILTTDGEVLGFGRDNSGQAGQVATTSFVTTPMLISGLSGIRLISAGTDSSFAIDGEGQLRSWGYNAYGELLLGYASPAVYEPVPSQICDNVSVVSGGGYSSLAWGVQGLVFGGRNDVGQAGNGPDPALVVGDYYYTVGNLTLTNLTMDLAGTTETLYDQIFIGKGMSTLSGTTTLNGIVNLMFVGTYTGPVDGSTQTFDLIWAKNGIVFGAGYQIAFNQSGYWAETEKVAKDGGEVLRAKISAVVTAADLAKAVNLAQPNLDGVVMVSYGVESDATMGIRQLSVSPSPVVNRVEMIYSYKRPTGGVMSGAEYFVNGITYRVEYTESLQSRLVVWNPAEVTGTTITPLGVGYERATLRISATGPLGFLRLTMVNPEATGISVGVGSATSSAGAGSATSN
jgi:alpha-tubulin suppressor-like RCC1 family protein